MCYRQTVFIWLPLAYFSVLVFEFEFFYWWVNVALVELCRLKNMRLPRSLNKYMFLPGLLRPIASVRNKYI